VITGGAAHSGGGTGSMPDDCVGAASPTSQGFNLDGDGTCGLDQASDLPEGGASARFCAST
jgi:hypothetical protein